MVRARPHPPTQLSVTANAAERAALAERFDIRAIESLSADIAFDTDGDDIHATGRLTADMIQTCAVSGDDFPTRIDEPLDLRFVPAGSIETSDEEIELALGDADEIEFDGDSFDLGEALAQSLGLAIDPYAEGPNADAARKEAGIIDDSAPRGQLADALAKLTRR